MAAEISEVLIDVEDGAVPVVVTGGNAGSGRPGVLCVPSIFGANDDLIEQMASLGDVATAVIMDPFWRVEAGAIPYSEREAAFGRAGQLDREKTPGDVWDAEATAAGMADLRDLAVQLA